MATSYNGWTAHPDKNVIGVVQHPVYSGGLKAGDVATVLQYVADQLAKRVEPVIPDHCWGYAYKTNANNPSQLSCHASGTAIDFNAPAHPNGKGNTFTSAQVKTIEAILREVDGTVKWLKGYDEMHFEIGVNAQTLAPVAARLRGSKPPVTTPPPTTPPKDWFDMATEADLRRIVADEIKKNNPAAATACWDVVMPNNAGGKPEVSQPGRKARDTMGSMMTLLNRIYHFK